MKRKSYYLIFLSLLFTIIEFIFKSKSLIIFQLFGIISLYLQITQIYYNYFIGFRGNYGRNVASIIELTSLAAIGCILCSFNFLLRIKKMNIFSQIILFSLIYLLFKYDIFIQLRGFRYPNVMLYISGAIILLLFFGSLNFEKTKAINNIISKITNFTGGIYYTHLFLYRYLLYIKYFQKKTYFSSIIIYILCYDICFIGNKLFKNSKLKYLFL